MRSTPSLLLPGLALALLCAAAVASSGGGAVVATQHECAAGDAGCDAAATQPFQVAFTPKQRPTTAVGLNDRCHMCQSTCPLLYGASESRGPCSWLPAACGGAKVAY